MFQRILLPIVGLLSVLVTIFVWKEWPDNLLHIIACDVGQGDGFLIYRGYFQMIVDTGSEGSDYLACIAKHLPFWDRVIEVVLISHPQNDHYGQLSSLVQRYSIDNLWVSDVANNSQQFANIVRQLAMAKIPITEAVQGQYSVTEGLKIEVLWPLAYFHEHSAWHIPEEEMPNLDWRAETELFDVNEASIVFLLSYRNFKALFTGDLSKKEELSLFASGLLPTVDVLKVPHHGSKTSSSIEFLSTLKPALGLLSVGKDNQFGHPNSEVLDRYSSLGIKLLRTDELGTIELRSDGVAFWQE